VLGGSAVIGPETRIKGTVVMKSPLKISIAALALGAASPAMAAPDCNDFLTLFSQPAIDCQGFYDKNVLSNGGTDPATQEKSSRSAAQHRYPELRLQRLSQAKRHHQFLWRLLR